MVAPPNLEYARRVYDKVIDWYKTAETKAQWILTVNGVFVTITFGLVSSNAAELRASRSAAGAETWVLLLIAMAALTGSICFATGCLLSRHNAHIRDDLAELGVRPDDPDSYRPESLWYFGHLASLRREPAVDMLRAADDEFELTALTYNVIGLSRVVLRKHRMINLGWALIAVTFIAMMGAGTSFLIRSLV